MVWIGLVSCQSQPSGPGIADWELPKVLVFAGDTIPIEDPEIRERLEKELWINAYWYSNTAQLIRRSGRWFPLIDSLLNLENVPNDFRYLVAIESGFENVTSNKGAVGFWQLMEPTARELGLRINAEMDERLHPEKSTIAACRYLKKAHNQLGNWVSVAASYNMGVQGIKNVMAVQFTDNYYDVMINAETGRYLFRALACKMILENPEKFGFQKLKPIPQLSFERKQINESIPNIAYWARQGGFSYKCFRILNPWAKGNSLTISDSIPVYEILIPRDCRVYTQLNLPQEQHPDSGKAEADLIFRHTINDKNMVGLKKESQPANPVAEFHQIAKGENLEGIANQYGISKQDLLDLNPNLKGKPNNIKAGMKLRLR